MKWIYILICFGLTLLFLKYDFKMCAYTYIMLIFGKLLWLDISIDNFKKELHSLKSLTRAFWYVFAFVVICIFATLRYSEEPFKIIIALLGIVIGFILGIICIYFIDKKYERHF